MYVRHPLFVLVLVITAEHQIDQQPPAAVFYAVFYGHKTPQIIFSSGLLKSLITIEPVQAEFGIRAKPCLLFPRMVGRGFVVTHPLTMTP